MREFKKLSHANISGHDAFLLFSSYGFPFELTAELAREHEIAVDEAGFREELAKHQELSRASTEGKFKGGLAGGSEKELKYHTATHLLHQALADVLGESVRQMGSNINAERLRFDFAHDSKLTDKEKQKKGEKKKQKKTKKTP